MNTSEILVLLGGIALIGLIVWYFFGAREGVEARTGETGIQEVAITVKGGYAPDTHHSVQAALHGTQDRGEQCRLTQTDTAQVVADRDD